MAWLVIADQKLALKSSLFSEGLTQCRPCRCVWREEKGSVGFLFWNVSSSTKTHSDLEYSLPPFSPKCFITLPVSLMILPMLCLIKLNCWGSSYKAETVNLVCWRQAVQGMTKIYHPVLLCMKAQSWERMTSTSQKNKSYCCYEGFFFSHSIYFCPFSC